MTKARDLSQTPNASLGFKNRIINGAMMIDQRNAGASVTPVGSAVVYVIDRWATFATAASKVSYQQNAGSYVPFPVPMRTTPTTSANNYELDIGDLIVSFTPLLYTDRLGQGIGWRPYRNVATSVTRGDTLTIDPSTARHPFNAEL